jgi:hypothetical protein
VIFVILYTYRERFEQKTKVVKRKNFRFALSSRVGKVVINFDNRRYLGSIFQDIRVWEIRAYLISGK